MRSKTLFLLVPIIAVLALASLLWRPSLTTVYPSTAPLPAEEPVRIVLVGDVMLDRGVADKVQKQGQNDWRFPFLKIVDDLKTADLLFGNLESQISDKGEKVGSIYSFRARPEAIAGLKFAGFDVLSLANNHAFDYGRAALRDSFERLLDAGLAPVGAGLENQAFAPTVKNVRGTRVAFFALTDQVAPGWEAKENRFGLARVSPKNLARIKQDVGLAKELADVVVVSLHWGQEYQSQASPAQKDLAHELIDAGADVIVGSHPHVVQETEDYRGRWIFYSLGNFVFDQSFSEETMQGLAVIITIQNKRIQKIETRPVKINQFFQPEIITP